MGDRTHLPTRDELMGALGALFASVQTEDAAPSRWRAEPSIMSVLRWTRVYPGSERGYTYAAVRIDTGDDRHWYITGPRFQEAKTWEETRRLIGNSAKVEIATGWWEIPRLTDAPGEPEDAASFVALYGGTPAGEPGER